MNREHLKSLVRTVPNYPKPGIMFRDITTLFRDPAGFRFVIDHLCERYLQQDIDYIVGIEARGFILASAMAFQLNKGFIPLRKQGKLPADVLGVDYQLEYGTDRIEMHRDALSKGDRVVIVDDLLATGGTALAGVELVSEVEADIVECCFVIDLPALGGKKRLDAQKIQSYTMIEFEGD